MNHYVYSRMFHKSLMMGYKLSVSDDHTVATVHLNGLSVDGFDRDGMYVKKEGRRTYLFNDAMNTFCFTVVRCRTYG